MVWFVIVAGPAVFRMVMEGVNIRYLLKIALVS